MALAKQCQKFEGSTVYSQIGRVIFPGWLKARPRQYPGHGPTWRLGTDSSGRCEGPGQRGLGRWPGRRHRLVQPGVVISPPDTGSHLMHQVDVPPAGAVVVVMVDVPAPGAAVVVGAVTRGTGAVDWITWLPGGIAADPTG